MQPFSLSRLIAEAGFAATNLGQRRDIRIILRSLPDWLDDPEQIARCEAILLFGLGKNAAAADRLSSLHADDCLALRVLLAPPSQETLV